MADSALETYEVEVAAADALLKEEVSFPDEEWLPVAHRLLACADAALAAPMPLVTRRRIERQRKHWRSVIRNNPR